MEQREQEQAALRRTPIASPRLNWIATLLRRPLVMSILLGLSAFAVMLLRGFLPSPAGLADNGDAVRFLCQLDLVPSTHGSRFFAFAIFQWNVAPSAEACTSYPSSQILLFQLWLQLSTFIGQPGSLDLRWAIVANALLIAVLTAVLARVMVRGTLGRILVAIAFLVVASDPIFSNYAASVLGEYPGLAGILVLSVGAVALGARSVWSRVVGLVLFAGGSLLAITSKTQAISLIVPLAVFLVLVPLRLPIGPRRMRSRLRSGRGLRGGVLVRSIPGVALAVAIIAALCVATIPMVRENPYRAINAYEVITVGVLGPSSDPTADLKEMGLPEELAKYQGKSYYANPTIAGTPEWDRYKDLFTYDRVAPFLLHHPDRALSIAWRAADDLFVVRPDYLGSYAENAGFAPAAKNPSLLAGIGASLRGFGLLGLSGLFIAFSVLSAALLRRSGPRTMRRAFVQAVLLLIGIALVQFLTAAFGEAIENTKHLVYGILALFLAPAFLFAAALCPGRPARRRRTRHRRGTPAANRAGTLRRDVEPSVDGHRAVLADEAADGRAPATS